MYDILPYSYKQAKKIGVKIYPSTNLKKKIDIFDLDNNFICSIGDVQYLDYPYYLKLYDKKYADERRRLYHIRHHKDINKEYSKGWFSYYILW